MNLGNLLKREGGVAETGRPVRFQVRRRAKDGTTWRVWIDAVLLPVAESDRAAASSEAKAYCAEQDKAPPETEERVYRFLQRALRQPGNLAALLVLTEDLPLLRAGLVKEQVDWLCSEYTKLISDEYPELYEQLRDLAGGEGELEQQVEGFTGGAQR